jgi:hypothetical protein
MLITSKNTGLTQQIDIESWNKLPYEIRKNFDISSEEMPMPKIIAERFTKETIKIKRNAK